MIIPRRDLDALVNNPGAAILGFHTPPAWTEDATCAQIGGDLWFPEKTGDGTKGQSFIAQAKNICNSCPVQRDCLDYALAYESGAMGIALTYAAAGIYGGHTPNERKAMIRDRQREAS